MHFFPSCACVTILTKKPNKTVSTKNHQYLQYSNVMNNTSGALRMIQTNTKYQNTYWTLEQLKKKQNTHNKLKWNANTLHLYIKKPQKLINTDQINLNKNLQYTKNYQLKPLHIKCEPVSLAKPKMRIPFTDFRIRNRTSVFNQYWCYVSI